MTKDGYPTKAELKKIENWDYNEPFALIDYISERTWMPDFCIELEWAKDKPTKKNILLFEFNTAGWSGNEDIIDALLKNKMFNALWYSKWTRGGHYWFEVNPYNIGYMKVSDLCIQLNVSKQYIHGNGKNKFDWLLVGGIYLVRKKILKK